MHSPGGGDDEDDEEESDEEEAGKAAVPDAGSWWGATPQKVDHATRRRSLGQQRHAYLSTLCLPAMHRPTALARQYLLARCYSLLLRACWLLIDHCC